MAIDTEALVKNSLLTVIARVAMIVATLAMPLAGFMMQRVIAAADAIGDKVDKGAVQMQLLQQDVKYGFDAAKSDIAGIRGQLLDHEGRLRIIERAPARPPN